MNEVNGIRFIHGHFFCRLLIFIRLRSILLKVIYCNAWQIVFSKCGYNSISQTHLFFCDVTLLLSYQEGNLIFLPLNLGHC